MKKIDTTVIEDLSKLNENGFKHPSKYYFINSLGWAVYIHTRSREVAEQYITDEYSKGFFKLRTSSLEKTTKDLTCTGSNTRKCFSPALRGLK